MTDNLTMSLPMRRAMFQLAHSPIGWVEARWFDGRCARALGRRGLVRNALHPDGGETGYAPTVAGREYIAALWPACPMLCEVEPEGGWTPEKGVGWDD